MSGTVKELLKSDSICQSYAQMKVFLDSQCTSVQALIQPKLIARWRAVSSMYINIVVHVNKITEQCHIRRLLYLI